MGLLIVINLSATIINIPADYSQIQQGIDVSADGDTILVQSGTYYENINYNGHNIILGSLFLTTNDTTFISQTIIDGNQDGCVVTFESGEDSTAVLCGFTITNGQGYGNPVFSAGGVSCKNNSNPGLEYLAITNNSSESSGGGMHFVENSSPSLQNIMITNNSSESRGGGIYSSNPIIHPIS